MTQLFKKFLVGSAVYGGVRAAYYGTRVSNDPPTDSVILHRQQSLPVTTVITGIVASAFAAPVLLPLLIFQDVSFASGTPNASPPFPYHRKYHKKIPTLFL